MSATDYSLFLKLTEKRYTTSFPDNAPRITTSKGIVLEKRPNADISPQEKSQLLEILDKWGSVEMTDQDDHEEKWR